VASPTPPAPAPSAPPRADGAADLNGLGIEPVPTQILTASPTTKRAVLSGDLVSLAEADYPPIALNRPAPSYPARARLAGQSGTVVLNVLVDGTGRVADVQVLRTIPGSDLHNSAAAAARTWTYKPATKDGLPVKVWKSEQVVFGP
jgi:protein TonB